MATRGASTSGSGPPSPPRPSRGGPAAAAGSFPWGDGGRVDRHPGWTIATEDALLAVEYHFTYFGVENGHYEFAPWVAWEEYPDGPLHRAPGRRGGRGEGAVGDSE